MRRVKRFVLTALTGAVALGAGVAAAGPRVEVEADEIQFGVVAPGDEVEARFELRNVGDATLEILDADPGCACTVTDYPSTIAAGETGYISATLDTSKLKGEVGKGIVVTTNDRKIVLTMKGAVISSATVLPDDQIYLNNLHETGVVERRIVRGNPLDRGTLEISGVESTVPWLTVATRKLDGPLPDEMGLPRARPGDWLLEIRVEGETAYGARSERVSFDTGLVRQPKLEIPVYARLLPPVYLASNTLVLQGDDPSKVSETLVLSVRHGLAPEELRVETEPEALEVELEPAGGRNYRAHVRWAGTERANGTIRFRIGGESYPMSVEWGEVSR